MLLTKHKEENFANIARGWSLLEPGGTLVCAGANDDGAASLAKQVGKALGLAGSLSQVPLPRVLADQERAEPPDYWRGLAGCSRSRAAGSASPASSRGIASTTARPCSPAYVPERSRRSMSPTSAAAGAISRDGCCSRRDSHRPDRRRASRTRRGARQHHGPRALVPLARSGARAAPATYDAIVCNPPFHTGRARLLRSARHHRSAARALRPGGRFYMVANRGLPYEPMLKAHFARFETLADNNKFRVTRAVH
jgi:16S rRNA (guanine1207-N2)-methyltransferase